MQKTFLFFILSFNLLFVQCLQIFAENEGKVEKQEDSQALELTLKSAFGKAIELNPSLKAAKNNIAVATGKLLQAGLSPNPSISIQFENFGGNGTFSGTRALESSFAISQEIVTSGKIHKKIRTAQVEKQIAIDEVELQELQLKILVAERYLEIFSLKKQLEIEAEYLALSKENAHAVARKVSAGEIPMIDETRANVELAAAKTEHKKLQRQLATAYIQLASQWGETSADFDIAQAKLQKVGIPEEGFSKFAQQLELHPVAKIARKQMILAKAAKNLARADSRSDLEFEGGVKKSRDHGKHSYFAGISLPLKIFDRNQGNIAKAVAQTKKATNNLGNVQLRLKARLLELEKQLESISEENANAANALIPGANKAFEQMKKAYNEGERQLFELFDARRILLAAKKVSAQLEADELKLLAEICLLTNQENLLFQILNQSQQEGINE